MWLLELLLLSCLACQLTQALEFMDETALGHDNDADSVEELPLAHMNSYSRDTVAHFNPRKAEAGFRQLWERIPLQKAEVIK